MRRTSAGMATAGHYSCPVPGVGTLNRLRAALCRQAWLGQNIFARPSVKAVSGRQRCLVEENEINVRLGQQHIIFL